MSVQRGKDDGRVSCGNPGFEVFQSLNHHLPGGAVQRPPGLPVAPDLQAVPVHEEGVALKFQGAGTCNSCTGHRLVTVAHIGAMRGYSL